MAHTHSLRHKLGGHGGGSIVGILLRLFWAQYLDPDATEVEILRSVSEKNLALCLDSAYPEIVTIETQALYDTAGVDDDVNINYWIDDSIGEVATKGVADSEEIA